MKIKKAAAIAEIVSAIAVIVTLLYVGYEIRQNTAAVKSTAYQSIHDAEDLFWLSISTDANLSTVWDVGMSGGLEALQPVQRRQYVLAVRRLIYLYQNVNYQWRKGVVDDELWNAWLASLDEHLGMRGFAEVLSGTKPHLSDPFVELLNSR